MAESERRDSSKHKLRGSAQAENDTEDVPAPASKAEDFLAGNKSPEPEKSDQPNMDDLVRRAQECDQKKGTDHILDLGKICAEIKSWADEPKKKVTERLCSTLRCKSAKITKLVKIGCAEKLHHAEYRTKLPPHLSSAYAFSRVGNDVKLLNEAVAENILRPDVDLNEVNKWLIKKGKMKPRKDLNRGAPKLSKKLCVVLPAFPNNFDENAKQKIIAGVRVLAAICKRHGHPLVFSADAMSEVEEAQEHVIESASTAPMQVTDQGSATTPPA